MVHTVVALPVLPPGQTGAMLAFPEGRTGRAMLLFPRSGSIYEGMAEGRHGQTRMSTAGWNGTGGGGYSRYACLTVAVRTLAARSRGNETLFPRRKWFSKAKGSLFFLPNAGVAGVAAGGSDVRSAYLLSYDGVALRSTGVFSYETGIGSPVRSLVVNICKASVRGGRLHK